MSDSPERQDQSGPGAPPAEEVGPVAEALAEVSDGQPVASEETAEPAPALVADPMLTPTSVPEPMLFTAPVASGPRSERTRKVQPPTRVPKPLSAYAIIETGGKQYRVSVGDTVSVERLAIAAGADMTIDRVLLLGGDGSTRVGTPTVSGAAVVARVEDHPRGEKIIVFKYKAKKRYRRRLGHRQELTRLTITGIMG